MKPAYYNEFDPKAAAWLRELIRAGHIAYGDVDTRSITEVRPEDLRHYGQIHLFAGIGGWSYALRLAGVPDDAPVWTGSCPCQPYSNIGEGKGDADERNLWPYFRNLIKARRPAIVFGEQVASEDGRIWLSGVRAKMEALEYDFGAADLCAAGVRAPHIRQRLYWMAHSRSERLEGYPGNEHHGDESRWVETYKARPTPPCRARSYWDDHATAGFRDGKTRRIEPGTFPVADGFPERMDVLEGYGNTIVAPLAAEFIAASLEAIRDVHNQR